MECPGGAEIVDLTYFAGYVDPTRGFLRVFVIGYGMSAHGFSHV
jgi:hypothetical protein